MISFKLIRVLFPLLFVSTQIAESKQAPQVFSLSTSDYLVSQLVTPLPSTQRVWIRAELKDKIEKVLQHKPHFLRTKYWQQGTRTVWVLEEVGKEKPITIGIVTEWGELGAKIEDVKVLAYRESRGWEVKHSFFTQQFKGLRLKVSEKAALNKNIDGITGATLSVAALKKMATVALMLDHHVRTQTP